MLISDFTIMCDDCGRKYRISSDSLDVDYACSERPMGTEVQHIFCGVMDCQCGNRLSYKITAVEYPEGAYNFHTCESVGCTYIDEPSAEMDYYLPEPVLSIYEEILQNPGYVYNLEPCEFEELVADVFRRMGFNADVTQKHMMAAKILLQLLKWVGVCIPPILNASDILRIDRWGLRSLENYTPLWKWNELTKESLLRHLISQEVPWQRHRD